MMLRARKFLSIAIMFLSFTSLSFADADAEAYANNDSDNMTAQGEANPAEVAMNPSNADKDFVTDDGSNGFAENDSDVTTEY